MQTNKHINFLELYEPIADNLWRFCLFLARDRQDAKDLLSETLLIAYSSFEKIKGKEAFLSYVFTIARRTYYREKKRNQIMTPLDDFALEMYSDNNMKSDEALDIKILYSALDKLKPEFREAIILKDIMGFDRKEIAEIQSTSLANVKIRLYRGKNALEKLLKDSESEYINKSVYKLNKIAV